VLLLDVIIRYPTVTLLLLFAVLALRDGWKQKPTLFAALLCISVAALLLGTSHPDLKLPALPHLIVRLLDVPSVALIWWFGLSMFEDDFKLGKLEWAGMAVVFFPVLAFRLEEIGYIEQLPPILPYVVTAISVLMMLHLFYVTLNGRKDDVIESRRRVRFYFVIALIVVTILIVVSERLFPSPEYYLRLSLFRAATILALALWGLLWLARAQPEKLTFEAVLLPQQSKPQIDPRDQRLYAALITQMDEQRIYTEPGLSIRMLAEKLSTPEHQLRALINKGMGYRNFSGFLNQYRIEAVQAAMNKPENARIPVLTLAMDVGFNSLAPFNRAFRAIVGETPTVYRSKIHK
jgi:AraC-like DNA-binding protein